MEQRLSCWLGEDQVGVVCAEIYQKLLDWMANADKIILLLLQPLVSLKKYTWGRNGFCLIRVTLFQLIVFSYNRILLYGLEEVLVGFFPPLWSWERERQFYWARVFIIEIFFSSKLQVQERILAHGTHWDQISLSCLPLIIFFSFPSISTCHLFWNVIWSVIAKIEIMLPKIFLKCVILFQSVMI